MREVHEEEGKLFNVSQQVHFPCFVQPVHNTVFGMYSNPDILGSEEIVRGPDFRGCTWYLEQLSVLFPHFRFQKREVPLYTYWGFVDSICKKNQCTAFFMNVRCWASVVLQCFCCLCTQCSALYFTLCVFHCLAGKVGMLHCIYIGLPMHVQHTIISCWSTRPYIMLPTINFHKPNTL